VAPPSGLPDTGVTGKVGKHLRHILGIGGNRLHHVGGTVRNHTPKTGGHVGGAVGHQANHLLNYLFAP